MNEWIRSALTYPLPEPSIFKLIDKLIELAVTQAKGSERVKALLTLLDGQRNDSMATKIADGILELHPSRDEKLRVLDMLLRLVPSSQTWLSRPHRARIVTLYLNCGRKAKTPQSSWTNIYCS